MSNASPEFKIEKGIPLPPVRRRMTLYPLANMEVGDSILVQESDQGRIRSTIWQFARRNGVKFVSRKESDGAIRIWRIE